MKCPHCGTEWSPELANILKFCGACGKSLSAEAPPPAETPPVEPNNASPGGELRYMTVIFADLEGFTAFSEDRSPDEVASIVGDLLQRLGRVVEQHNGVVDKFLGDAVVATFGAPNADPNAGRNAVRAGLAMQEEATRYNTEKGFDFGLRVGVHAGEAMYRIIGGAWTVMGDTVNTASRIQSVADPGSVWISQTVYDEVRRYFETLLKPAIELRGKKNTIQPYQVLVERAIPHTELPPFVGREAEWQMVREKLQYALTHQTLQTLCIRGVAGIGKSRVIWELQEWAKHQSELFHFDTVEYDLSQRLPSHGLNSLIRSRFNLPVEISDEGILKQLAAKLNEQYRDLQPARETQAIELLAFTLGIQRPDFQIASMDGPAKWSNAFAELKTWMESVARQVPWIIVIEDVQKGDADTAAFLDWALRLKWNAPVLLIVTIREEDFNEESEWHAPYPKWKEENLLTEIRLREIPPKTLAQALVVLGDGKISPTMAMRIAEHTEGNPLFATETALLIKEQKISTEDIPLPASIREVMEARIERLGLAGKEVAKRGALMGRRFTIEAVSRIWDRPTSEMEDGIAVLHETETVYQEASKLFAGETEQVFRHGRLHEVALARIPREERVRWLAGLENWAQTKLDDFGEYWEGAGVLLIPLIARARDEHNDHIQASLWHEMLGWLHKKNHRGKESIAAFLQAFEHADGVRRLTLARQIAEIDIINGDPARGEKLLETVLQENAPVTPSKIQMPEKIRQLIDDPTARWERIQPEEALVALRLAHADTLTRIGKVEEAKNAYAQTKIELEDLRGVIADILRMRWANLWGYLMTELVGDAPAVQELYAALRKEIDFNAQALQSERMSILGTEVNMEMRMGRYGRAKELADELLKVAQQTRNTRVEARAWNAMGITLQGLGQWDEAIKCYENCLKSARFLGDRRTEAIATHNLGLVLMDEARFDEACEYQQNYLQISRTIGNHLAEAYAPAYLGLIAMSAGDFDTAQKYIDEAITVARANNWLRLVELAKTFGAMLKLNMWLKTRQPELLNSSLNEFAEVEPGWHGLDEIGEFYTAYIIASKLSGNTQKTQEILQNAYKNVDESWTTARASLAVSSAIVEERAFDEQLAWFGKLRFVRWVNFLQKFKTVLQER
jgi:class 3 adenylate cyclase/tetratricopeptide (TPR) repeat protein